MWGKTGLKSIQLLFRLHNNPTAHQMTSSGFHLQKVFKLHIITLHLTLTASGLHHYQIVFSVVDHVQLSLIVKLRLYVDVVFLSKDFCDEWSGVKALTCRRHHERVCVISRDSLVLLKRSERMMVNVRRRRQLQRRWKIWV